MTDKLGMTTDGALTTLDIHSLPEETTYDQTTRARLAGDMKIKISQPYPSIYLMTTSPPLS
jgi:hypothetical protein